MVKGSGAAPPASLREDLQPELRSVWDIITAPNATDPGAADLPTAQTDEAAALSTPEAWSVAIFGPGRTLRSADGQLARWLEDPSTRAACLELVDSARRGETHFGLIGMADDGVVAVCGAPAAVASRWTPGKTAELTAPGAETALVAFAPTHSVDLVRRAAEAFGLSPLESRLVEALLQAPTLEVAAQQIGVGRETAKDALANAMRKVGVDRSAQLIARVVTLICGAIEPVATAPPPPALAELSAAESRVAMALAKGETAESAAALLGVSAHTVKSHRKAVFAKLGVNRIRDLSRVMAELQELQHLTARSEVRPSTARPGEGRLRVVADDAGRRVALLDYGPASGRPIMVGHGLATGLRLPPALVRGLQRRGYRPLSPQRPGFGLTDPTRGDYLDTAADDMALILTRIGAASTVLLMREGGTAAAFAFGHRHPGRLERGLLLNPRLPVDRPMAVHPTLGDQVSRFLMHNPRLIGPFFEALRRRTRSDLVQGIFRHVYTLKCDVACAAQPEVSEHLVRDVQGLVARTSAGVAAEHLAYARGWRVPDGTDWTRWTMAYSDALCSDADLAAWRQIGLIGEPLRGAGLLAQFTHAEDLAARL